VSSQPEVDSLGTGQLVGISNQRAARSHRALQRAESGAEQLVETTKWESETLHLDARVLLGNLLAHPTAKFIGFAVGEKQAIYIAKKKLRATKRALKPFGDVRCYLDGRGLHFRWHGSKGGLDFISQIIEHKDRDRVFLVDLPAKLQAKHVAPAYADLPPPAHSAPRTGAWLGAILHELDLLL